MFNNDIVGKFVDSSRFELIESIAYVNSELEITVKAGFISDMASIPKMFWGIIGSPFEGKYRKAALIHDGLYGSHWLTKKESDALFLEMMKVNGVSWLKRYTMYYAVKWFGNGAWNKPKKKIEKVKTLVEVKRK